MNKTLIVAIIVALIMIVMWLYSLVNRNVTKMESMAAFVIMLYGLAKIIEIVLVWGLGG